MKRLSHQEREVRHERVAGLDVHPASVNVCLVMPGADGKPVPEIRRLATTTGALLVRRGDTPGHLHRHLSMSYAISLDLIV